MGEYINPVKITKPLTNKKTIITPKITTPNYSVFNNNPPINKSIDIQKVNLSAINTNKTPNENSQPHSASSLSDYDAINISTYTDIPYDYDGYMGVPVTFLDKYNPEQFEIYGLAASAGYTSEIVGLEFKGKKDARPIINGKTTYARIFIKRRDTNENWIKRDLY